MTLGCKETAIGPFPDDWEIGVLRDLVDPVRTIRYGIVQPGLYDESGRYMIRGQDYSRGWVDPSELFRVSAKIEEPFANARVRAGDVLMTIVGASTGRIAVVPAWLDGANLTQTTARIALRPDRANGFFCAYALAGPIGSQQVSSYLKGAAQPGLNCGDIERFLIPLPPRAEQDAIAQALGDVDALLEGLTRLIAKKRDLKQAAMQQLLTGRTRLPGFGGEWASVRIAEIGDAYGGLTGKSSADFGTGGARYIAFMDVMRSVSIRSGSTFERVRVGSGEAQNAVKRGDLLLNGSSETPEEVAMCAVCDVDEQGLFLNSFCFGFRLSPSAVADALFLAYLLRSDAGRKVMRSLAQGSTRYNIAKSAFLDACLLLPSKSEQAAIVTVLSDMDAELAALEARRAKTKALKHAMMQELLTGRIRLRSPEPAHA